MNVTEYRTLAAKAMSENELQTNIIELAEVYGWIWWHDNDSRRNEAGFPDLILCRPPRLIAAELKTEKGRLREAQQVWFEKLTAVSAIEVFLWRPSHLLAGKVQGILR